MRGADTLNEAERAVLRLLAQGHDIKSSARLLGLSVHSVTERLRDARRKLGVTSSREAARLLAAAEGGQISRPPFSEGAASADKVQSTPRRWIAAALIGGTLVTLFAVFALLLAPAETAGPPRVVAVSPAQNARIAPGTFTLRVTFDQPMRDRSWSFVQVSRATYPDCDGRPVRSADGRSFSMQCRAQAGRSYEIWFNRAPYLNFKSAAGAPAQPFGLRFAAR